MSAARRDSRWIAVLLSALVCPGAGQIYKRNYIRGGILVAGSIAVVTAMVVRIWEALMKLVLSMPPEDMLMDLFGVAHRIAESEKSFFTLTGYLFAALWAAGVVDAAFTAARPGKDGGTEA